VSSLQGRGVGVRQGTTLGKLLDAGLIELDEAGPEGLTIRQVAHRAGVSPATAYNHLASKPHLFALLYLRHLQEHRKETFRARTPLTRVQELIREQARDLAATPQLAAAATMALLSAEPDVEQIRVQIGLEMVAAFRQALADAETPTVLDALIFAQSGALLQAGMGFMAYAEMGRRLEAVAARIMDGRA
jgi:AcrR family transcriptional regulator